MLFEREDWKLFRNLETLPQKAGVPKNKLSLLVCKELTDNALDVCGECEIGFEDGFFYVKDHGPGMDPGLFAINRPLKSSRIADRILLENNHEAQAATAFREVKQSFSDRQIRLAEIVPEELARQPVHLWREVVARVGDEVLRNCPF